jgi:hypothetical protein
LDEKRVISKKGKNYQKRRVRENMKLGQQEIGVYPIWIGILLLIMAESIILGLL